MGRKAKLCLALVLMIGVVSVEYVAQNREGTAAIPSMNYNTDTEETLTGTVVNVQKIIPRGGGGSEVFVRLKTDNETVRVLIGPVWFLDHQAMEFKAGDKITVVGSRIVYVGRFLVIARTVTHGDQELVIRDKQGWPNWEGLRRAH